MRQCLEKTNNNKNKRIEALSESPQNCFFRLADTILEVWLPTNKAKLMLQIVADRGRNLAHHSFTTTAFHLKHKQENHLPLCIDAA